MSALLALLLTVSAADAVRAWRREPSAAADALAQAAADNPRLRTALQTLLAESLLAGGRRGAARRLAEEVRARDRRWAGRAAWIAARATIDIDCRAAIAHATAARPDPPWIEAAPRLGLLLRAQRGCGEEQAAQRTAWALATEHPHTVEGQAASASLAAMGAWSAADRLARARGYERARDYVSAREALAALVGSPVDAAARFELARLHLERLRVQYDVAIRGFRRLAAEPGEHAEEAAWLLGRTLGRAGDVAGALGAFDAYLRRYPKGRFADDARFFGPFLRYEQGRFRAAASGFASIRRGKWARAAAWYDAWCRFLDGADDAAARMDALAKRAKAGGGAARRAAYWAARALEGRKPAEARARRAAIVAEKPHGWYALLIARRFPEESRAVPAWPPGDIERSAIGGPEAEEVRALHAAGLSGFARRALRAASPGLRGRKRWALEVALADEIGDHERVYRTTMVRHGAKLRGAPDIGDAPWWRAAYPRAHPASTRRYAGVYGVAPGLVYTFMRKESAFDVDAVSPAHAVGLMQLLPRTAGRIVERLGGRRGSPELFDPDANIELGTWYVAALQARFQSQLPLVAAAYNAGPEAVASWARGGPTDTDIFVERIPFRETRGYVKRIVETYVAYRWVHDGMALAQAADVLPRTLDLEVKAGVDF